MFKDIYTFELKNTLKRPLLYIFTALFVYLAYDFAANTSPFRTNLFPIGNAWHNAPYIIARFLIGLSIFGALFTTVLVGTTVYKDFQHRSQDFFFTAPIRKISYLGGRFGGALTANLLIFIGAMLGLIVGCMIIPDEFVGPYRLSAFLHPFIVFLLPNLLLLGVVFFALASLTRNMVATYVATVVVIMAFAMLQDILSGMDNQVLASLIEPFGSMALQHETQFWTVTEQNTLLIPLSGVVLYNRLVWLGITTAIAAFMYLRFQFVSKLEGRKQRSEQVFEEGPSKRRTRLTPVPVARLYHTGATHLKQCLNLVWIEFRRVAFHPAFLILMVMTLISVYRNFVFDNVGPNASNVYPLTSWFLPTASRVISGGFIQIITLFFAGALVWRERDYRTHEIVDALPTPNWVPYTAKLVALMLIQTVFVLLTIGTGIFTQASMGYLTFQIDVYLGALVGVNLVGFWHLALIAILCQILSPNKYVGFLLTGVFIIISEPLLVSFGLTDPLYRYGVTPGYTYSDMTGFGHFAAPIFWYRMYWFCFGLMLFLAGSLLWVRGYRPRLGQRFALVRQRLSRPYATTGVIALAGFISLGAFIFYNTHVLNPYRTDADVNRLRADYERRYQTLAHTPQPMVTHVDLEVDLYPEKRDAHLRGVYLLQNKTTRPVDTVQVFMTPFREPQVRALRLSRPHQVQRIEGAMVHHALVLDEPLLPADTLSLYFALDFITRGFKATNVNNEIVENGTYLDNFRPGWYLPFIGYDPQLELRGEAVRAANDLPERPIFSPLEDSLGARLLMQGGAWVALNAVVSTRSDQTVIAPGNLVRTWTEGDRAYAHFRSDTPMWLSGLAFFSGRYDVARDTHQGIDIEVYFHANHAYNVERMIKGIKRAFDYNTRAFSPYQHEIVRIVEVPNLGNIGGTARSLPSIFAWTETGGFVSNLETPGALDVVFNTTTHEMAHQWWGHQVAPAAVEGAGVLVETMAQWVRIMTLEREYGPDTAQHFREREIRRYLRGRSVGDEMPLMRAIAPNLLYRKGTAVMYALGDYIGEDSLNVALRHIVDRFAFTDGPFPTTLDLLNAFRAVTPDSLQFVLTDLFETITLYDLRAIEATYHETPEGNYQVHLTATGRKLRADARGRETEILMQDYVDIGVFGAHGQRLYWQKHKIDGSEITLDLLVDALPARAGLDPAFKLIDRNWDDNVIDVQARAPS